MVAPSAPNKFPTRQGTVVAGQPSLVTLVITNADGTSSEIQFYAPPGASITVPPDFMTTADSLYFLSSSYGMGSSDLPGVGLHWDGPNGKPLFVYGATGSYQYLDLLSNNDLPTLMRVIGNTTNLCCTPFTASCVDGQAITFPVAFAGSLAFVFATAVNNEGVVFYTTAQPSNTGFTAQLTMTAPSGNSRRTTAVPMVFLAIGVHS